MAAAVTFQVRGLDALQRRLDAIPPRIQNKVYRAALRKAVRSLARQLKADTPRTSGATRRSIKQKVRASKRGAWGRVGYTTRSAFTIRIYEYGSRRQPARPFFRQAAEGYRDEAMDTLGAALQDAVEREGF